MHHASCTVQGTVIITERPSSLTLAWPAGSFLDTGRTDIEILPGRWSSSRSQSSCGSQLHTHQHLKTYTHTGVIVNRWHEYESTSKFIFYLNLIFSKGFYRIIYTRYHVDVCPLTLTRASIGAEDVANGRACTDEASWCVGAAVGTHVTSSRKSTLVDVYEESRTTTGQCICRVVNTASTAATQYLMI